METVIQKFLNSVPNSIDFGFITAGVPAVVSFTLPNPFNKNLRYKINTNKSFRLDKTEGTLFRKHTNVLRVTVFCKEAEVLIGNAKIKIEGQFEKVIKFSCISKFPYIRASMNHLDFGQILVGKTKEMELILENTEEVEADFTIDRINKEYDPSPISFFLSSYEGSIPPNSKYLLKVKYVTHHSEIYNCENFEIKVRGSLTRCSFDCAGASVALSTRISSRVVDFKTIEMDEKSSRYIRVYNDSEESTQFQFFHDNTGVFKITPLMGKIASKSNVRVVFHFLPKNTVTYYERIFCLVENHNLMVFY